MTKKEIKDFDDLYFYVKALMGYDESQPLTRKMVLRLKGLGNGKLYDNNYQKDRGNIGFDIILLTLKMYNGDIVTGLSRNTFKNDEHKFNYILKICETHMNEVYRAVEKKKNSEELNNLTVSGYLTETKTARGTEKYKEIHKEKETKITNEDLWGDL